MQVEPSFISRLKSYESDIREARASSAFYRAFEVDELEKFDDNFDEKKSSWEKKFPPKFLD